MVEKCESCEQHVVETRRTAGRVGRGGSTSLESSATNGWRFSTGASTDPEGSLRSGLTSTRIAFPSVSKSRHTYTR